MIIHTKCGRLEGLTENGMNVYKGIPYAKAPVGELRFRKPVAVEPWEGIRDASRFGKKSIQRKQEKGSFYQVEFYNDPRFEVPCSEDCLYLNVYTPEDAYKENKKYPVAVYIHGGAYMGGAGSNLPFVPTHLVAQGVIAVTINYRLGVWGFAYKAGIIPGNLGLWDQIMALEWVRENIEAFGGDNQNITAFGQSAGAMSLQILTCSTKGKGLFDKMILQSGGGYQNPLGGLKSKADAEEAYDWMTEALGADPFVADAQSIQEACGVAVGKSFRAGKMFAFVPVLDGDLLTEDLADAIDNGHYADIPYLLGANENDLTTEKAEKINQEDNPMQVPNIRFAKIANRISKDNESYVYYFTRKLPGDDAGSFHSAELWYVFGSLEYSWRPMTKADRELSDTIIRYWTDFMKYGSPCHENRDDWRPCTEDDPYTKILDCLS